MEKSGGRPKEKTTGFIKEETTGYENTKTETKPNVNDNVNDNDNDNVNANVNVGDSCVDGLQKIFEFYENNIGLITPYGTEILQDYYQEMPEDLIIFAMKKAVEANVRTIKYIKGILNNWSKKGIKTVIEAQKEDELFRNKDNSTEETEEEKTKRKIKELEEALNANK